MAGKNKSEGLGERLDRFGREVVRAAASNETEAESAAASPFLYARIRSRIAERVQREEREPWLATLMVVWRAVPALALVAVFAFILFLSVSSNTRPAGGPGDYAFFDLQETTAENVVFADTRNLSRDEVLVSIMGEDEQEASR